MQVSPQTFRSVCPMDCPDACSLDVTVEAGRVTALTGNRVNPVTGGYICGKMRRFPDLMYGPDRLLHPAIRRGRKGAGGFTDVSWDEALNFITEKFAAIKRDFGAEAILPYSYGGSNGYLSQDTTDARFFRRLGASRLARTVCAAATGRAVRGLYGAFPGVAYADYLSAKLIVLWGVNPSTTGIHVVPYLKQAKQAGAKIVVIDPRRTQLAKTADLHLPVRPGADLPLALSILRWLFESGRAAGDFLTANATGMDELRARASQWTFEKAALEASVDVGDLERFAQLYAETSPAVIRCGWGPERNRNGGSAIAAILALPAVAGKFGVRGGGFTMSNSLAWDLSTANAAQAQPPATRVVNMNQLGRALLDFRDPPIQALFIYNSNPLATTPDQERVRAGLRREDLFTVVFEQVKTDTAQYADVLLPATTFLEHEELSKGYGSMVLQRSAAAAPAAGASRPNFEVFADLCRRMGLAQPGDVEGPAELVKTILQSSPRGDEYAASIEGGGVAFPPCGPTPIQFVDVFPTGPSGKIQLVPPELDGEALGGLYSYKPDPGDSKKEHPLALISPASSRTISSSLAQLWKGPGEVEMHPRDAEARGISTGANVRVFNELGEVRCSARVNADLRPGVAAIPKGLWARHTQNGRTASALAPDTLADLGGGACFNDARVEIVLAAPDEQSAVPSAGSDRTIFSN